ncbi:MAG: succinate dehydrogenase, cytochrome b556 subunit [Acidimicrobiia bacterium]|nr:succinate dehydrogenase, cytochrome b556 subunit [Acidimicrobiia bacterium]
MDHRVGQSLVSEAQVSPVKVGGSTVYKGKSGQWSFVAHRTTGFLVFFFLLMHVVDVSLARFDTTGRLYNEVHHIYGNILMRLFEVGLLFALWFHALNGLRIIVVDFFPGAVRRERMLTVWVVALTFIIGIPMAWIIVKPFFEG